MNIYIDEAGVFIVPKDKENLVSCVGALIIPESLVEDVFDSFRKIKSELGFGEAEVKGSILNESQTSRIIKILRRFDIIFEVTAIDMALHTDEAISAHKLHQAALITENITPEHQPQLVKELEQLKQQYESLSNQLYVQSTCMVELLSNVLQKSTLYYVQRMPKELEIFHWYIDAKNKEITPYENLLTRVIAPALQDISRRKKFIQIMGADYSHFQKYMKTSPLPPEHLRPAFGDVSPFNYLDITDIFKKNISFEQSCANLGIQIVDILTTSIKRAMNNHLKIEGWGKIGRLMVQAEKSKTIIQLISLIDRDKSSVSYSKIIEITNNNCKRMLL